jgi:hypothetical protein
MWVAGTTTTRVTTIGLGTGGHGSTADAITTIIEATEEVLAESLGALVAAGQVAAGQVAVAGQVAAVPVAVAGQVAVVVADDCPTQG